MKRNFFASLCLVLVIGLVGFGATNAAAQGRTRAAKAAPAAPTDRPADTRREAPPTQQNPPARTGGLTAQDVQRMIDNSQPAPKVDTEAIVAQVIDNMPSHDGWHFGLLIAVGLVLVLLWKVRSGLFDRILTPKQVDSAIKLKIADLDSEIDDKLEDQKRFMQKLAELAGFDWDQVDPSEKIADQEKLVDILEKELASFTSQKEFGKAQKANEDLEKARVALAEMTGDSGGSDGHPLTRMVRRTLPALLVCLFLAGAATSAFSADTKLVCGDAQFNANFFANDDGENDVVCTGVNTKKDSKLEFGDPEITISNLKVIANGFTFKAKVGTAATIGRPEVKVDGKVVESTFEVVSGDTFDERDATITSLLQVIRKQGIGGGSGSDAAARLVLEGLCGSDPKFRQGAWANAKGTSAAAGLACRKSIVDQAVSDPHFETAVKNALDAFSKSLPAPAPPQAPGVTEQRAREIANAAATSATAPVAQQVSGMRLELDQTTIQSNRAMDLGQISAETTAEILAAASRGKDLKKPVAANLLARVECARAKANGQACVAPPVDPKKKK